MTRLVFLSPSERRQFDLPPLFTHEQRPAWFVITQDVHRTLSALRTPLTKVSFILQLGYFRHSGKFFAVNSFRKRDIKYVRQLLNVRIALDLDQLPEARIQRQRIRILQLLGWKAFDSDSALLISEHIQFQAQRQLKPEKIIATAVDYCWRHCIEIPSYHHLTNVITDSFNIVESALLNQLQKMLTPQDCAQLDELLDSNDRMQTVLSEFKTFSHSLRAVDIQLNVDVCARMSEIYLRYSACYDALDISDMATEYYATWVHKAALPQLRQFASPYKRYLYLLAFIRHQYCLRQDLLMDSLLKSTRTAINAASKQQDRNDLDSRRDQKIAMHSINADRKSQRQLLAEIVRIVRTDDTEQPPAQRMTQLQQLLDDYEALQDDTTQQALHGYEKLIDQQSDQHNRYTSLEAQSRRLQRRIAPVLKVLVFDKQSSDVNLLEAVQHFRSADGQTGAAPPLGFLPESERVLFETKPLRISLYKILLFRQVALSVRAGKLNLQYSYRYRAIQDYLIPEKRWQAEKERLLSLADLTSFADGDACLENLKVALDDNYQRVNKRYHSGENEYLNIDENGKVKVRTPATDFSQKSNVSDLLADSGIVPVLQVLREIDQQHDFTRRLTHLSPKNSKLKLSAETLLAGILGIGCNIGLDRLTKISSGLNASTLKNTVTWCFSLKNLQQANDVLVAALDQLALSEVFVNKPGKLHTSSDGRKVGVATDSLHANYSFKYFGKDKGVALYTFLDERHALFYSTVISASEREAAYVIDGLMHNEVIKSDIHSTDTHGYTESIFAAAHLIDMAFAPRIKRIHRQKLYSFSGKATHQRRGDVIQPSRAIDHKLILQHWDDILRFMATIKLRHSSASQLFKRLSSYSADHPLYKALKEFGRLIKTQFILTYYDDVELRQRIEKQLNKVEQSNRLSKAVFFANSQEFQHGDLEQQQITAVCTAVIQNAIVLWNAMVLSQRLLDADTLQERIEMLTAVRSGSLLCWQHVNLQGEYDFRPRAANEDRFDLARIRSLRLPEIT